MSRKNISLNLCQLYFYQSPDYMDTDVEKNQMKFEILHVVASHANFVL